MNKIEKLKNSLQRTMMLFASVSTDKGLIAWVSDGELPEIDEEVKLILEDGSESTPDDGIYTLETGRQISIKEGKCVEVLEISDPDNTSEESGEPEPDEKPEERTDEEPENPDETPKENPDEEPEKVEDDRVAELEAQLAERDAKIAELEAEIERLKGEPQDESAEKQFRKQENGNDDKLSKFANIKSPFRKK